MYMTKCKCKFGSIVDLPLLTFPQGQAGLDWPKQSGITTYCLTTSHLSLWFTTAWGNADSVFVSMTSLAWPITPVTLKGPPTTNPIWSSSTPLLPVPVPNTLGANLSSAQNNNLCKSFPPLPLPRHPLPFLHTYHPSVDLKNLPHWQTLLSQEKRGVGWWGEEGLMSLQRNSS